MPDINSLRALVSNNVYEASRTLEDLENQGIYKGNGHHARQSLASFAELLLLCGTESLSEEHRLKVWELRKLIGELHTEVRNANIPESV